jgi:hypothetical protein
MRTPGGLLVTISLSEYLREVRVLYPPLVGHPHGVTEWCPLDLPLPGAVTQRGKGERVAQRGSGSLTEAGRARAAQAVGPRAPAAQSGGGFAARQGPVGERAVQWSRGSGGGRWIEKRVGWW